MLQTSAITDNIMVRDLPSSFESADEWPMCSEIIMRIHNQGRDRGIIRGDPGCSQYEDFDEF